MCGAQSRRMSGCRPAQFCKAGASVNQHSVGACSTNAVAVPLSLPAELEQLRRILDDGTYGAEAKDEPRARYFNVGLILESDCWVFDESGRGGGRRRGRVVGRCGGGGEVAGEEGGVGSESCDGSAHAKHVGRKRLPLVQAAPTACLKTGGGGGCSGRCSPPRKTASVRGSFVHCKTVTLANVWCRPGPLALRNHCNAAVLFVG